MDVFGKSESGHNGRFGRSRYVSDVHTLQVGAQMNFLRVLMSVVWHEVCAMTVPPHPLVRGLWRSHHLAVPAGDYKHKRGCGPEIDTL